MRGVHQNGVDIGQKRLGSSPHARGPPAATIGQKVIIGIIPACAGSTGLKEEIKMLIKDHPRMRGVHPRPRHLITSFRGSSPHARGPLCDL